MDETKEKPTTDNSGEGSKQETTASPEQADKTAERLETQNKAAERLEKATAEANKVLDRREAVAEKEMLGGVTDAGKKKEVVEESPQEYSEKLMNGEIEFNSND